MATGVRPSPAAAARRKFEGIGAQFGDVTRYAMQRAFAHHEDPRAFPLPAAARCQERAFAAALEGMPRAALRRLGKDAAQRLRAAPAQRRAELGAAADLDPASPRSAVEQMAARPVPAALRVTQADLRALADVPHTVPRAVAPGALTKARLVAKSIQCVQDSLEPGRDEIVLGGLFKVAGFDLATGTLRSATEAADNIVLDVHELGKFKAGEGRDLGDEALLTLSFIPDAQFPLMPLALLLLGEKDLFGFQANIEMLSLGFDLELVMPLFATFSLSGAVGFLSLAGYFTVASVFIASAWAAGITVAIVALVRLLGDEMFNPGQTALLIDGAAFRFPDGGLLGEPVKLVYKRRRAHYELTVQWQLEVAS